MNLLNSWPETWFRDNSIEKKGKKNKEYQFPTNPIIMDEIKNKND
jgi:hypothetical protein